MSPGRELNPISCFSADPWLQITQTQIMRTTASGVTRVALPINTALVGGLSGRLWPPHDTMIDASFTTTRQPPPVA